MGIYDQIAQLDSTLADFKSDQQVDWQVGLMANAMIEKAKQSAGDDPVVAAIQPFTAGPNDRFIGNATAGTVRAVLGQLISALPATEF